MNQQNGLAGDVAAEWEQLTEQWRRGRASAPTRRDLKLALQEIKPDESHEAEPPLGEFDSKAGLVPDVTGGEPH